MKKWTKPVVAELTAEQLAQHIKAAARSMQCQNMEFR